MTKPQAAPPNDPPKRPETAVPKGAWDAHVHLVAGDDFPLWDGRVEDPAPGLDLDGWLGVFQRHLDTLGFERAVIVHSILYGDDNSVTLEAIRRLGPHIRGVGLVRDGATGQDLDRLYAAGIRAVRLNYVHGGVLTWDGAQTMAPMLADRGMHIQMLAFADQHVPGLADDVRACPVPVVFDHFGWPDLTAVSDGFKQLVELVAEGAAFVKLSAPYRVSDAPYVHADGHIAMLAKANHKRCLWGSDWPHLMLADARKPDAGALFDAFSRAVPDADMRQTILVDTPQSLFDV